MLRIIVKNINSRDKSKAWNVDLQEGQEVQVYRSLPLVQFDPEHEKLKKFLAS